MDLGGEVVVVAVNKEALKFTVSPRELKVHSGV